MPRSAPRLPGRRGCRGRLQTAALALAAAGCQAPDAKEHDTLAACSRSAIVGGTPEPAFVRLRPKQFRALATIRTPQSDALCSGVLIGANGIVTSAHCFDRDRDGALDQPLAESIPDAVVTLGSATDPDSPFGPAGVTTLHPHLDVAVVTIVWLQSGAGEFERLPPSTTVPDSTWIGSPVELAGYGATANGAPGALGFVVEELVRIEPDHLVVDGQGRTGACAGDSGGPILTFMEDGAIGVVGILDDGDPSCKGEDYYTRIDRLLDWEPFRSAALPTNSLPGSCDGIARTGMCLRGRAFHCGGDTVVVDDCRIEDRGCGWDEGAEGFRCVSPADDHPCRGFGSFARCEGETVLACVGGVMTEAPCTACSARCEPWVNGTGAACQP